MNLEMFRHAQRSHRFLLNYGATCHCHLYSHMGAYVRDKTFIESTLFSKWY